MENLMEMEKNAEILIVEDSEEVLWIMSDVLDRAGFYVDAVTTGKEALRRIRECPETGLVILNYLLSDMSGLTVLKRLKKNGSRVKVISTSAMKETREVFVNAGAFAFLEIPFDIGDFVSLCRQALNGENAQSGITSQN